MDSNPLTWTDWTFNIYTLITWMAVIVIGIILGFKQKITVFRNYNDLCLVFLLGLVPVILMYAFFHIPQGQQEMGGKVILLIESAIFLLILFRTFQDNRNPFFMVIALITKITLSVLFIINLIDFVTPSGKNGLERTSGRRKGFVFLLALTPIVFALVKTKEGIFNPERTLASRGIRI